METIHTNTITFHDNYPDCRYSIIHSTAEKPAENMFYSIFLRKNGKNI